MYVFVGEQQALDNSTDLTWIERYESQFPEGQVDSLYLTSIYMVVMTLTTVGYGDGTQNLFTHHALRTTHHST